MQRLSEQVGRHAVAHHLVAPRHLVDAASSPATPVSAPEENHVLTCIGRQYHRRLVGLHALQDIHDVGRRQVGILIVDDGSFAQVLAIGIGTHGSPVAILRGIGHIVGADEDDMIVVVAASLQHLVDIQHIGLMAVVLPSMAALHQHSVLVGKRGIGDGSRGTAILLVELLLGSGTHGCF